MIDLASDRWRGRPLHLAVVALVVVAAGLGVAMGGSPKTLILYDSTGPYGWLGELYAVQAANLASHFGPRSIAPVLSYRDGMIDDFTAVVYLGSTYDESDPALHAQLPGAFIRDVLATNKPVIWLGYNIWHLATGPNEALFERRYGWGAPLFDPAEVTTVRYKGGTLTRSARNDPIVSYTAIDRSKITVLAEAVRPDGTTFPWASRSANLTYVGEIPFNYTDERDRQLIFADLLFDALAPSTPVRRRALLRLEDISPASDPERLLALAEYLGANNIPFGFGVTPRFADPLDVDAREIPATLAEHPKLVAAIRALIDAGGVPITHGYTHQYGAVANPYDGKTGDDVEFFRQVETADGDLDYVGPVPEDSPAWVNGRLDAANAEFRRAGLPEPAIFEFPHYIGSVTAYRAVAARGLPRWEQGLYFAGTLDEGPIDYSHRTGQMFPYVVTDVYGSKVLPENVGGYSPSGFHQFGFHGTTEILAAVRANLVVRDSVVGVFYHHYFDTDQLEQIVDSIESLGYRFVHPFSL